MAVTASDGALKWEASIDLSVMKDQIKEINKMLGVVGDKAKQESDEMDKFSRNAAKALATYISVTAISGFVTDIVRVRGEFQQLEVAFTTMLRSKEKADALMAQIVDLAARTPFGLQEAAKGAKQLLAYGFAAEQVKDTLTTLGNVASGVGAPLGDIVYLYGTLRTQGRAYQKDIMQFTGRGIPIIEDLAKQFGVTTDKVNELVEAGKVGFPEVQKAFQAMVSEGGIFNNLMEEQSKTISGLISKFGDAWEGMLNDIGKSQEGPIADIIKGSIAVVENYQKVLDIIKVLVASYGAYRAAVIATAVAQTIAANATKGWTIAETLRYRAMMLSAQAMKVLNATMLSNPAVALATGVTALVTALILFRKEVNNVKSSQQLLNEAGAKLVDNFSDQKAKITPLIEEVRKGNLTEEARLRIYNDLNKISPELVKGLDQKTLGYAELSANVNLYLEALRKQMKLEANAAAIRDSIENENSLQKRIDFQKKNLESIRKLNEEAGKTGTYGAGGLINAANVENAEKSIASLEESLKKQQEVTKSLAESEINNQKANDEKKIVQNKQYWEEQLKTAQSAYDALTAMEIKAGKGSGFLKQIKEAKEQLKIYDISEKAANASIKSENRYEKQLEKRAKLVQDIADLERSASQSGLLQRDKEMDQINARYDQQLESIKQINEELTRYNNQNPNKKVSLVGDADTSRVNAARQVELNNLQYREDAENYISALDEKKAAFEVLQQVQLNGSIEQVEFTKQQYKDQIGAFDSYVDYLKNEAAGLMNDVLSGTANLGDQIKFEALVNLISEAGKAGRDQLKQSEQDALNDLLQSAKTFDSKRADIEKKYSRLYETLEKQRTKISEKEYEERRKNLEEGKKQEVEGVAAEVLKNSEAFKELQNSIEGLAKNVVLKYVESLKTARSEIIAMGGDAKVLDKLIDDTFIALSQRSSTLYKEIAGIFGSIGSNIELNISDPLKITSNQISQLIGNIANIFDKGASKTSQVGSIIGVATLFTTSIRDALMTAEDMAEPLHKQTEAYESITAQVEGSNYALERQLDLINELSGAQKLNAQQNYLADLKNQQDGALKSLQEFKLEYIKASKEIFVDPLFGTEMENKGVWGVWTNLWTVGSVKKKMKYELEVIDTSSFNTIEDFKDLLQEIKLNGGKINGQSVVEDDIKGLQLFIDTYDDLEKKQKDLKNQLDQIYTSTTADSIADSIIAGFKAGKSTMEDFASDFEELMRNAVLNSLKYQSLEKPIQSFYDEFAKLSASDNILTEAEIQELNDGYAGIIANAREQFENLKQITRLDLSGSTNDASSLTGAIKGMTEQQAELLAGQFGALRMTALDHLNIARSSLDTLGKIESNTFPIREVKDILRRMEINGVKVL